MNSPLSDVELRSRLRRLRSEPPEPDGFAAALRARLDREKNGVVPPTEGRQRSQSGVYLVLRQMRRRLRVTHTAVSAALAAALCGAVATAALQPDMGQWVRARLSAPLARVTSPPAPRPPRVIGQPPRSPAAQLMPIEVVAELSLPPTPEESRRPIKRLPRVKLAPVALPRDVRARPFLPSAPAPADLEVVPRVELDGESLGVTRLALEPSVRIREQARADAVLPFETDRVEVESPGVRVERVSPKKDKTRSAPKRVWHPHAVPHERVEERRRLRLRREQVRR